MDIGEIINYFINIDFGMNIKTIMLVLAIWLMSGIMTIVVIHNWKALQNQFFDNEKEKTGKSYLLLVWYGCFSTFLALVVSIQIFVIQSIKLQKKLIAKIFKIPED